MQCKKSGTVLCFHKINTENLYSSLFIQIQCKKNCTVLYYQPNS